MSLDLDRIKSLLDVIEKSAGHPNKLTGLSSMAMRELLAIEVEAKAEHDKLTADEAKKVNETKAAADAKAKKDAEADKPVMRRSADLASEVEKV